MAVTILQRPEGYTLSTTQVFCVVTNNSGNAIFGSASHGLSDGDVIYVVTAIEDYNGFVEVAGPSASAFFIRSLSTGEVIPYIANADDTSYFYKATLTHGWSCAHLPIVYRLSNDKYPTNSVDTARTITSISDDHGLLNANLSGSLGTFEDLSFVKISNAADSNLNGIYQIIDKIGTNDVTLNINYASTPGSSILGATIQLYYSNYNFVVRVYVGINSSHQWTAQKPYELAATLELIPDSDNQTMFSINEIIKAYIQTKNNLLLGTLPNNIDAWAQFYIETAEQYDTSNGYSITTLESSFTSDQSNFEGVGVNAMLPFKNVHSGYLSEYLMTNNTAKFLTLFAIPVLFSCSDDIPDCYSDISFLNPCNDVVLTLRKKFYLNGNLSTTINTSLGTLDSGVIREELEADCSYDRVDISIINSLASLDQFINYDDGTGDFAWTLGANPSKTLDGTQESQYLLGNFITQTGVQYSVNYTANFGVNGANLSIYFMDENHNLLNTISVPEFSTGIHSGTVNITPTGSGIYIGLHLVNGGVLNTFTLTALSSESTISETKQFKIDCGCANQEIRLTWLNNLGGFDYWKFTGETDHTIDISASGETKQNIFPEWPKSYGENADTIRKQTFRDSAKREFVFSQQLTQDEVDAIAYIKSSPLVQIINSRQDRRTVLVDTDSFSKYKDGDKTYTISFNILYTDDIPSQRT